VVTAHDEHGSEPHESNWLITLPLIVLGFGALVVGFLNAPAFKTEEFTKWVEPAGVVVPVDAARAVEAGQTVVVAPPAGEEGSPCGTAPPEGGVCFAPELQHAPFEWSKALVSLAFVFAGIFVGMAVSLGLYERRSPRLVGLTQRSRLARAGYVFLVNRYFIDFVYEKGVVAAVSGPISQATYWTNQEVIDGVVNGVGHGAVLAADATYEYLDQGLVDGLANGAGTVAEGTGEALQPIQSGKVSLYGALLFGAAAIGALILVIVV
jgi:NADH-quinone oxidoreductase subunit L